MNCETIYGVYIGACLVLTMLYVWSREQAAEDAQAWEDVSGDGFLSQGRARLTYVPTAEGQDTVAQTQVGYRAWRWGKIVFFAWAAIPVVSQLHLLFHGIAMFTFDKSFADRTSEWIFVFSLSHGILLLMTACQTSFDTFFMCKCRLKDADFVGVVAEDPAESVTDPDTFHTRSLKDPQGCIAMFLRLFLYSGSATKTIVVKVFTTVGGCQYFEYTCIRYVFDDESRRFRPHGKMMNITGTSAHNALNVGGTSQAGAESSLQATGKNEINVEVPTIFQSLFNEFFDYVHIFQMVGVWNYVGYSSPNLSIVWFLMLFCSGVWKALWIVRKNQSNIREMAVAGQSLGQTVLRDGKWISVKASEMVLGDIVQITEGPVCADLIVLGGNVVVNESMLTGEPMPINKVCVESHMDFKFDAGKHGKKHAVYAGTDVLQSQAPKPQEINLPNWISKEYVDLHGYPSDGYAVGIVAAVGGQTTKGQLIRMVLFPSTVKFRYTEDLPIIFVLILVYTLFISLLLLLFRGMQRGFAWWFFSMFSLLTETLNPMLGVSIATGQSAANNRLKESGILCLSLGRIPIAGKVSVMIFDKTGTITHDGMDLHSVVRVGPLTPDCGTAAFREPVTVELLSSESIGWEMLRGMATCHTVTVLKNGDFVGNAVEVSTVKAVGWQLPKMGSPNKSVISPDGAEELLTIRALEFDHKRMTSGAVVQITIAQSTRIIVFVKGAYDKIQEKAEPHSVPADFRERCDDYAGKDCFYVLALGWKELPSSMEKSEIARMDRNMLENGLTLCGLLLFRNEVKPDSAEAIENIKAGSIRCVMCTGDNVYTGVTIGRNVGLFSKNSKVLIGTIDDSDRLVWQDPDSAEVVKDIIGEDTAELALSQGAFRTLQLGGNAELNRLLPRIRVFGRMKPDDKISVIELWQKFGPGHVTGMTGDGGNDCGALRVAHAGIALSSAEASLVSPFSTSRGLKEKGYISLSAVHELLLEGRACLSTNLATYMAFMHSALIMTIPRAIIVWIGDMCWGEWHFICLDIFMGVIVFCWVMPTCRAARVLAPFRPTARLLGTRTMVTILSTFSIYLCWLMIMWLQLLYGPGKKTFQWWDSAEIEVPALLWNKKADNHIMAVLFPYSVLWLGSACFVFSYGHVHRESVFKNTKLVVMYMVVIAFVLFLCWTTPNSLSCLFRVNCDNPSSMLTGQKNWIEKILLGPFVAFSMGDVGGCFLGAQNLYCHPPEKDNTFCWIALPSTVATSKSFYPGWDSSRQQKDIAKHYAPPFSTFEEKHQYCNGKPPFLKFADGLSDQQKIERGKFCWYPDKDANECRPKSDTKDAVHLAGEPRECEAPHNCWNYSFSSTLTILMACSIAMFHFVYRYLLLEGPGAKFRRVAA